MTHFRIRYRRTAGHVHVLLYSSRVTGGTFALNGNLCFTPPEWDDFLFCFRASNLTFDVVCDD